MKFYHSGMSAAPVLSGTAGSLNEVLNACLVDGFGLKSVTSLVVAGGVATATVVAPHTFVVGGPVNVAGATPTGLNGDHVVTEISATTVKFATAASDGTATGAISIKMPSLGWVKSHTGTNKAVYRPSAVEASGFKLRVDDTGTLNARVVGYESMTDVDTGLRAFPTAAQMSGGYFWSKSNTASAAACNWAIFGDERLFYIAVAPHTTYTNSFQIFAFGDGISNKSGDPFACILTGNSADRTNSGSQIEGCVGYSRSTVNPTVAEGRVIARSHTGIGGAQPLAVLGASMHGTTATYSGGNSYGLGAFPNKPDNSMIVGRVVGFADGYRITLPGLYHLVQNAIGLFSPLDVVPGTGEMAGRTLMMMTPGYTSGPWNGVVGFDISGPWR